MSRSAHLVVDLAVALSPAEHRAVRAEEWRADLEGAAELEVSSTMLALGALTTALFHRHATHRTTWGESMSSAPHTIRTTSLLVALAFATVVVGALSVLVFGRYNGPAYGPIIGWTVIGMLTVVPGALMVGAVLLTNGSTRRRRAIGAVLVAVLALRFGSVTAGLFPLGPDWLWTVVVATGVLAVWFLVTGRRGTVWPLLVVPAVTLAIVQPAMSAMSSRAGLSSIEIWATVWIPVVAPFAAALLAGFVAALLDRAGSDDAEVAGTPSALVDRTA